jgi:hypothetical protein
MDRYESVSQMTIVELKSLIKSIVELVVAGIISEQMKLTIDMSKLVNVKDLCKEFGVTRQIISNWKKSPKTSHILKQYMVQVGKRTKYNLEGLKQAMIDESILFGNGRDYNYTSEISWSDQQEIDDKLSCKEPLKEKEQFFFDQCDQNL